MTEDERQGAVEFMLLMVLLLSIGIVRELMPFGVRAGGTAHLRFGFGRAKLHSFSGVVSNYKAVDHATTTFWRRTHADGRIEDSATTDVARHEEFDLVHDAERHHVHTSHPTMALSDVGEFSGYVDKSITAVWATKRLRRTGPYVLFRTLHSGTDIPADIAERNIGKLLAPRMWTVLQPSVWASPSVVRLMSWTASSVAPIRFCAASPRRSRRC